MPDRPFKRAGLHRIECRCGNYTYSTVAALERFGVLRCPCGELFEPTELELAALLGVECEAMAEYRQECESIAHGQASHGMRGRVLESVESKAAARVAARRRERARTNRINALRPAPEPMAF